DHRTEGIEALKLRKALFPAEGERVRGGREWGVRPIASHDAGFGQGHYGMAQRLNLTLKIVPSDEERVILRNQGGVVFRLFRNSLGFTQQKKSIVREILSQRRQGRIGSGQVAGFGPFFQKAQLTARREDDTGYLLLGKLRARIEVAQRFQFVAKEFQPYWPGT